jgi:catechol 2,3-dioxygenase-like lactoylglutathione lyase family enzyme
MLDHVTIRGSDQEESRGFYNTVLEALGFEPVHGGATYYEWGDFSVARADREHPVTHNLHVAFAARSREDVDAFWQVGVDAGYRSDGEPGPRPQYTPDYYGGFLLDPDGNSAEAVHRPGRTESGPPIDHLWIRVADLEASRRFYETVAPVLGVEVGEGRAPGYVFVAGAGRHLALVADGGALAENVHLAFPVRASAPSTTRATSAPSSSTPTATTSRR